MTAISALKELEKSIPAAQIKTDDESLKQYGVDWTNYFTPNPLAIVFPQSTKDVQSIVLWAKSHKIAVVPSGGRTGLSGGAVALNGEAVISLEKMNDISNYNPIEQTVHCQAGVITENLQNYALEKGAYFPVDFAARGSSHVGGNIATNAGGIKVLRYGLMRDWVASLTVVTGTGEILSLNNSLIKNASGYDFRHLMIGSEGTLGIITEATIKLTRPPKPLHVMILGMPSLDSIMKVYSSFRANTDLMAFELFSDLALKHVLAQNNTSSPLSTDTPYYLLVEFEETSSDSVDQALKAFEEGLEQEWISDGVIAQSEAQAKEFWALREDITEATIQYKPYKNDISVTLSKVPEFIKGIDQILGNEYPHFEVVWFGHIGDGNLHINILKPKNLTMDEFLPACKKVDQLLFSAIEKLGGSISAEHGVGLTKKNYLHHTRSQEEILLMKSVKQIFDPQGIINPGKVFD